MIIYLEQRKSNLKPTFCHTYTLIDFSNYETIFVLSGRMKCKMIAFVNASPARDTYTYLFGNKLKAHTNTHTRPSSS